MIDIGAPMLPALAALTLSAQYTADAGSGGGGSVTGQFLTLAADASLTSERILTPGSGLAGVDLGPNSTYTLSVDATIPRTTVTLTAGAGLTGGGDLSANRTFDVGAGAGITVNANDVAVDATVARSSWPITAGAGLTGGGNLASGGIALDVIAGDGSLTVAANDVRVAQGFGFTWSAVHTFNATPVFAAGATISAGQNLSFGADVAVARKAANLLALAAGDSFQAVTYTSGVSGWNIAADGSAEFANVAIRGELSASVFKLGEITAVNGTFGVFKSAASLFSDYTAPGSVGASNSLIAKNSLAGGSLFAANDILRIKSWNGTAVRDLWFTVTIVGSNSGTTTNYTVRLESGTVSTTFTAGTAVEDYGPSGAGFLTLSADGTIGSSANMTIADHAGAPWTTQTTRVRLGNLNGAYGVSTNIYGVGIGDYSGGNYLLYDPTDGFVLKAAGGAVRIDVNGLGLSAGSGTSSFVTWYDGGAVDANINGVKLASHYALGLVANPDSVLGIGGVLSLSSQSQTAGAVLSKSQLELSASEASGTAEARLFGTAFAGLTVGAFSAPNAMLDVRGSGIVTGGFNVGSATGAGTGEIKMSDQLYLAAWTTTDNGGNSANIRLTRSATQVQAISFAGGGGGNDFGLFSKPSDDTLYMGTWNGGGGGWVGRFAFDTLGGFYASGLNIGTATGASVGEVWTSGPLLPIVSDAATNTTPNALYLGHNSSGTPLAGFGTQVTYAAEDSTTINQSQALDVISWTDPAHATRKARRTFSVYDTAAREAMRMEASGTVPMIGFYGHAAVTQPAAPTTLADVIAIIRGNGLSA